MWCASGEALGFRGSGYDAALFVVELVHFLLDVRQELFFFLFLVAQARLFETLRGPLFELLR